MGRISQQAMNAPEPPQGLEQIAAATTRISGKNLDIEVLRAVAVLMILVDHIKLLAPWPGATDMVHTITSLWGGVDVFFAISGFVITSMFLRQPPAVSFVAFAVPFWIRRVYRIWPSALLWLAVMVLSALFFNRSGAFGSIPGAIYDAATVVVQVANFISITAPMRLAASASVASIRSTGAFPSRSSSISSSRSCFSLSPGDISRSFFWSSL
jgi:peptidoglycan/LPS O-acetylase OafA/YrhL